jgi:hypothetical protein
MQMNNKRRQELWEVTGGKCFYCHIPLTTDEDDKRRTRLRRQLIKQRRGPRTFPPDSIVMEIDHKIPTSCGGSDFPPNVVACCIRCNALKQKKTSEDFRQFLIRYGIRAQFFGYEKPTLRDWLLVASFTSASPQTVPEARKRFARYLPK